MALHPAIETIHREPRHEVMRSSGFERRSSLFVKIILKKEYWGAVDPEDLLEDDRLPATFSAWPTYPYPQTNSAGTLKVSYSAKDPMRILQNVTLTSTDTFSSVNFRYDYDSNPLVPAGSLPPELRQNPEGTPPGGDLGYELDYGYEEIELPYTTDANNVKVKISSGERPDPLPTVKYILRVCNITRLEPHHRIGFHDLYSYVLNEDEWNGHELGSVCSFPITYSKWKEIGGAMWWPVNYTFKWLVDNTPPNIRPVINKVDFWKDVILSMSLNQKGADDKLQRIRIKEAPSPVPQPLDADGHYIDPPDSAEVHKTAFEKIKLSSFDVLGITLPAEYVPPTP